MDKLKSDQTAEASTSKKDDGHKKICTEKDEVNIVTEMDMSLFEASMGQLEMSSIRTLLKKAKEFGFQNSMELYHFSRDFSSRPEALSSLLQSDFGVSPFLAHQMRSALLNMVEQIDISQKRNKSQDSNTVDHNISVDASTIESRHARAANEDMVQDTKTSATTAASSNPQNTTPPDEDRAVARAAVDDAMSPMDPFERTIKGKKAWAGKVTTGNNSPIILKDTKPPATTVASKNLQNATFPDEESAVARAAVDDAMSPTDPFERDACANKQHRKNYNVEGEISSPDGKHKSLGRNPTMPGAVKMRGIDYDQNAVSTQMLEFEPNDTTKDNEPEVPLKATPVFQEVQAAPLIAAFAIPDNPDSTSNPPKLKTNRKMLALLALTAVVGIGYRCMGPVW